MYKRKINEINNGPAEDPDLDDDVDVDDDDDNTNSSAVGDAPRLAIRSKYRNRQRVLVFCSRGVTSRFRHLMEDVRKLTPHNKKDVKFDSKGDLNMVNEIAEIKNCNNCIFFEARKHQDLYLWISKTPNGPSVKFHVSNVHTMDELKLTGNCMIGSRPLLNFDASFDSKPHLQLIKSLMVDAFGTPCGHPKSKPFIDRVMSFLFIDNKIWVRNYQIIDKSDGGRLEKQAAKAGAGLETMIEIGPRFVLDPMRIFSGSFYGSTLYQNPNFVSPNEIRAAAKREASKKYSTRTTAKRDLAEKKKEVVLPTDGLGDIFT